MAGRFCCVGGAAVPTASGAASGLAWPSWADRWAMYCMVRRSVSILVSVCPAGATEAGRKERR